MLPTDDFALSLLSFDYRKRADEMKVELLDWIQDRTGPFEQKATAVALLEMGVMMHAVVLGQADAMKTLRWMFTPDEGDEPRPNPLAVVDLCPEASIAP